MFLAALFLFQHIVPLDLPTAQKNPFASLADLNQGKKLYAGRCAGCHGPMGDGGKGTNLAVSVLPRSGTDIALYRIIRYGLPETEMPAHNMTQREIWQIAAHVRTLGHIDEGSIRGDVERGKNLVNGKGGCLQCHLLNGNGGHLGPPLTEISSRRSPSYLRTKLTNPNRDLAPSFFTVNVTTKSGGKFSGVRLNEDTWSVQLRDANLRLHSFWKQDLAELTVDRQTTMPSYAQRLSEEEREDIVAFLAYTGRPK